MKSFDEWLDTTKLRGYIDENSLEAAYEAGQQSKQAEVDELRYQRDVLSNKIDEVLKFTNDAHSDLNIGMLKIVNILKGGSHES